MPKHNNPRRTWFYSNDFKHKTVKLTLQLDTKVFNFLHTFSATRRCMDTIGTNFFGYAYEQVAGMWGDPEDRKTVNLDFVFMLGVKKIQQVVKNASRSGRFLSYTFAVHAHSLIGKSTILTRCLARY